MTLVKIWEGTLHKSMSEGIFSITSDEGIYVRASMKCT